MRFLFAVTATVGTLACAAWWSAFPGAFHTRQVPKHVEMNMQQIIKSEDADLEDDEEPWGAYPEQTTEPVESLARALVGPEETVEDALLRLRGNGLLARLRSKSGRQAAAKRAASHVRAKIGLPEYRQANVMVASRLVRDYLSECGVRPSHIAAIAPIAVALVFVPTAADIEAKQMLATAAAVERREAMDANYYTDLRGNGWFGGLRTRRVVTAGPRA